VTPAERLAELGLALPAAPAPLAAYVPAVRTGSLLFTSGQVPVVDGALAVTGVVGEGAGEPSWPQGPPVVAPDVARELARTAALNALAVVAAALGDDGPDGPGPDGPGSGAAALERVVRVVKLVGYVASAPGFTGQPRVVDGASALLAEVLGDAGHHARSAVGVAALPGGAPVEVELVVEVG
jgi:enamine deaminase RidA (YjgF/YER057c/UK114 family)